MKNLIIGFAMVFGLALSAQATIECQGQGKDSKVSISILDLATKKVVEGEVNPVAVRVTEEVINAKGYPVEAVLFAGVVNGKTEDVLWFLSSPDRKSLKGTIYMDELTDIYMKVGSREIRFTCGE